MLNGTVLALFLAVGSPGHDTPISEETLLTEMFQYARHHNITALQRLRAQVDESHNGRLRVGYALSMYIADPVAANQDPYIDAFPEDRDAIMIGLYEQIELKRLTPRFLYSLDAIGTLALDGKPKAIVKVIRALALSDGVVTECLCDTVVKLFLAQLGPTIRSLGAMPEADRVQAYQCLQTGGEDQRSLAALEATLGSMRLSGNEGVVVKELTARVTAERMRAH
jgi:hypothetical protein